MFELIAASTQPFTVPQWAQNQGFVQMVFGIFSTIAGVVGIIMATLRRAGWLPKLIKMIPWFARPLAVHKLDQLFGIAEVKFAYPENATPEQIAETNGKRREWVIGMVRIASSWMGWWGYLIQWAFANMDEAQMNMIFEATALRQTKALRSMLKNEPSFKFSPLEKG